MGGGGGGHSLKRIQKAEGCNKLITVSSSVTALNINDLLSYNTVCLVMGLWFKIVWYCFSPPINQTVVIRE